MIDMDRVIAYEAFWYSIRLSSKNLLKQEFLQWLFVKCALNPNFIAYILFADKVIFTQNKITNFLITYGQKILTFIQTNH